MASLQINYNLITCDEDESVTMGLVDDNTHILSCALGLSTGFKSKLSCVILLLAKKDSGRGNLYFFLDVRSFV